MLTVWNTIATYSSDRQQGSSEVFVVDYPWPWRYKKKIFFYFILLYDFGDTRHRWLCTLYSPIFFGCISLSAYTLQKINISTGETWVNKCVKAPYALSVKALWVTLGGKITCCKNTVNSTAECAEEKSLLASSWRLQLYWVIRQTQTATLTFSDLYVESSTVGLRGGGAREGKRPGCQEQPGLY